MFSPKLESYYINRFDSCFLIKHAIMDIFL